MSPTLQDSPAGRYPDLRSDTPRPVPERTLQAISVVREATTPPSDEVWRPSFLNLIDLLLPEDERNAYTPDELRSARLVAVTVALFAPSAVLFSLLYGLIGGLTMTPLLVSVSAAWSILSVLRLHRGLRPPRAGLHVVASMLLAITAIAANAQGVLGAPAGALAVMPLLALVLCTRRVAAFTLYLCALIVANLTAAGSLSLLPNQADISTVANVVHGAGITAAAIGLFIVAHMVVTTRAMARGDVEAINGSLACEVKEHRRTRQRLRVTHQELMTAARRAGAAEVATGVLHNVGNGLNAVNVSAAMVDERLHSLRLERVGRLAQKLDDTPGIDPRLAAFAHGLFKALEDERAAAVNELRSLRQSVDHVAATVATQQRWAQKAGVTELVDMPDMIDEVHAMIGLGAHHDIEMTIDIGDMPSIITDRHRVMQIVTNLLTNAKDAVKHNTETLRRIRVCVRLSDTSVLTVAVTDTGSGIDANHVHRIFQHGFTTKPTGHGFGLHASALAAKELDGSLEAHSPGLGQGATFILTVPVTIAAPI